jgi:5-methylcytosine-specific restriction enzyme A
MISGHSSRHPGAEAFVPQASRLRFENPKNMHPFSLGQEYQRQALLDFVGSRQAQPGVIWGSREPGCVICTSGGRHGKKAGYADGQQDDGSWIYIGQGTNGDQRLENAANAKLASRERSVLLFTTREPKAREVEKQGYGKLYTFRGSFNVAGFDFVSPETGPREGDRLLRFFFVSAEDSRVESATLAPWADAPEVALQSLQRQLIATSSATSPGRISTVEYRARSAAVHRYALLRANGSCECCGEQAPFESECGVPYLEVHHLLRLADDGPDIPSNVAAVCPNCHRALHLSRTRHDLASSLAAAVEEKERDVARPSGSN